MKKNLSIFLFFLFTLSLTAQNFDVPKDYSFEKAEDYSKQRNNIVKAVTWLENTPIGQETEKRKEVSAYLMQWLTGTPDVTISLNTEVITFMDCADCLMVFMGSWAKYAITNKDYKNELKASIAGIESVIKLYENNKSVIKKNKAIEKYIRLKDKGKLENDIKSKI
ncbi:MAG TPA: hypothetical protein VKN14_12285 [Flavobacteriaceae bacterium]|nr:hypothetical protein [Flavobacteriaceae bacterium]